ncbi:NAD(P)H-binding protein [Dyadobacter sp. LJ53]|uniref:NAD(P)-dependent oxidoreductase n=1 Tax=Dyadobacter chenwenxiniae TaxID=2906456 RepID=UPI001F43C7A4|nr:NAD(P)H-binding protein [Dyadobacter chenwenxiniae]MCF0048995.1 NAD(P)H-binding protein [Dyadobacter chenwenxiniae]
MKIAIIGASAGIGSETVRLALQRGHTVKALSRNNAPLAEHQSLTKINGTALSVADLKTVIADTDVVIVTVGTKVKKGTKLFSELAKALVVAISETAYKGNVLIVSGFGTGDSAGYLNLFMRLIIRFFLKDQYKDKTLMEKIISESKLNWEFIKPGMLTNGPLDTSYKVITELYQGIKVNKISRASVADYLVNEAEAPRHLLDHVLLSS